MLSLKERRLLAAQAASLQERLEGKVTPISDPHQDLFIQERLRRWELELGGPLALKERLTSLQLRFEMLEKGIWKGKLPSWISLLCRVEKKRAMQLPSSPLAPLFSPFFALFEEQFPDVDSCQLLFLKELLLKQYLRLLKGALFFEEERALTKRRAAALLCQEGLWGLAIKYPAGVRALCQYTEDFCRAFALARKSGRQEVQVIKPLNHLYNILATVWLVEEKGVKWVFKPRSLNIEARFSAFISQLRTFKIPYLPRCLKVEEGDQFGKTEYVESSSFIQPDFKALGGAIALACLLGITDLGFSNLLFDGKQWVFIDLEGAMVPKRAFQEREAPFSILNTGAVTHFIEQNNGKGRDRGTAAIWVRRARASLKAIQEVMRGFEANYRELLKKRDCLDFSLFSQVETRYLPRNLLDYLVLKENSSTVEALSDGLLRSITFEQIFRATDCPKEKAWVIQEEIAALERERLPLFYLSSHQRDQPLPLIGKVSKNFFSKSGWDHLQERLSRLGEQDLRTQKALLESALLLQRPKKKRRLISFLTDGSPEATLKEEIARIEKIPVEEMQFTIEPFKDLAFTPVGFDASLFRGRSGWLLFLSALFSINPTRERRKRAMNLAKEILSDRFIKELPFTWSDGSAGIVWALYQASMLLQEESLKNAAIRLLKQVDLTTEGLDCSLFFGIAGGLLVLLSLSKEVDRHLIEQWGEEIFDNPSWPMREKRRWLNRKKQQCQTGYGRGITGIALALVKAGRFCGREEWIKKAQQALQWEDSQFVRDQCNWQSFMDPKGVSFGWGHGAPGIVLGRDLLTKENLDLLTPCSVDDLEKEIVAREGGGKDHLLGGLFGHLEILNLLGRPRLDLAERAVLSAKKRGYYRLNEHEPLPLPSLSLVGGEGGIGYVLLRLLFPQLPSFFTI